MEGESRNWVFSDTTSFAPSWVLNCQHFVKASLFYIQGKVNSCFPLSLWNALCILFLGFPGNSRVKNPPAMQGILVRFLGWEDPLEEGIATHSSFHAWRIPVDRGAWWAMVMGSQRVGHDWKTNHNTYCFCDIHHIILWWVMGLNSSKHVRSWKQDWSDFFRVDTLSVT